MKLASKPVWGRAREGLAVLEAARREGLTVMGDWYPYPYWQSAMYVLIPDRDFENVEKWRVGLDEIGGAANVRITNYGADPSWNGKTLAELAAAENIDAPSLDRPDGQGGRPGHRHHRHVDGRGRHEGHPGAPAGAHLL